MAGYVSGDLKLRVADTATNKLRLYTLNELSMISVLLIVAGICLWSLIKVPVLECDRSRHDPSRALRCRAKMVVFFGVVEAERTRFAEPSDREIVIDSVTSAALVPAVPSGPSPLGQFGAGSVNNLRISGTDSLPPLIFHLGQIGAVPMH